MIENTFPILEFDSTREAILEPSKIERARENMPQKVVYCFFSEVLDKVFANDKAEVLGYLRSEIGKNPVYVLEQNSQRIAVIHPGVGAALSGTFLEETIAWGGRKFIAVGGAGVLDKGIGVGHVVIPTHAIRDEGTSYHYLPASRDVAADLQAVQAIQRTLDKHGVPYNPGKTWTTDAPYRETTAKVAMRRAEGCLTVEMEAAAFFAIAQYRGVQFGQMLYGGDDVSGDVWDSRNWHKQDSTREKLFWLAVEAAVELE